MEEGPMKLWKISQTVNESYDTYDSAVIAAETEEEARMTHPGFWWQFGKKWDGKEKKYGSWCNASEVTVEYIGEAAPEIKAGVIVSSFNA